MSLQTRIEHGVPSSNRTILVQVGDVCCSIKCHDKEVFGNLQELYREFPSEKPVDTHIELEVTDRFSCEELETVLSETEYIHTGNYFSTTTEMVSGEHDDTGRALHLTVERELLNPTLEFNHLNRFLSSAYYTACKARGDWAPSAFLVHSCAIRRNGRVMLFSGPCESGKTTIARLCGEQHGDVINDETVQVSRPHQDTGILTVRGVPFVGGAGRWLNVTAPLGCVLLLKQSQKTAVRHLDRMEAYLRFMRQIIAPAYIGQAGRREIFSMIAEFADEVTRTVPFYELEFTLDKEALWKMLDDLESLLEKGREQSG
ncbi:MAG: hypothetical protein JSV77_05065 [Dehalococcoidales bacterium]|nr:MAG: hypothetical protein JSV77_05065 [Dehalococcoidales bacterium]